MASRQRFSQRHPFFFGFALITLAVALIIGAMAFFQFWMGDGLGFRRAKLGVVYVQGTIADARRVNRWIEDLRQNPDIQGVLVRIDSPGGVVAPAQEMHAAVRRLAETKPVVVSMGSVAASGGYYVACGADTIVANPGTITGSIGVKANVPNVRELMDKIGLREETIVSGEFKDAGSPTKPLTPEERAYFQKLVDDLFSQFVDAVAKGRGMKEREVRRLADGRAYTGQQALELGLVDELGDRAKAVDILRNMCDITRQVDFVEGPEERSRLWSLLLGEIGWAQVREALSGTHALFAY